MKAFRTPADNVSSFVLPKFNTARSRSKRSVPHFSAATETQAFALYRNEAISGVLAVLRHTFGGVYSSSSPSYAITPLLGSADVVH